MNETMITEWNDIVSDGDEVYILGDVAMMAASKAALILNRLNGSKILIQGNHDFKALKDHSFRKCFKEIHQYYELTHNGTKICMFHYPIHFEWNQAHRGSVLLYGHVHGNKTGLEEYRARDVGFDATGNVVTLLDDIVADALTGKIAGHHVRDEFANK